MNQQTVVQDFETPVSAPAQEAEFANEWAHHTGILVGGMRQLAWDGIGEMSVGHSLIRRRIWMPFIRLQVGRRAEFDGALDLPASAHRDWSVSPDRIITKSPRLCAMDVLHAYKEQGYCVPQILIGYPEPQTLTEKVWPRAIRDSLPLHSNTRDSQIKHFENFQTDDDAEAKLAAELLEACYISRTHCQEYVRLLKQEFNAEHGLSEPNEALKELFYEIDEPLPEHKTALVASAMGQAIVKGVTPDGRKDDAIVNALNSIAEGLKSTNARLDSLEKPGTGSQEPTTEGVTSNEETPNTQPRLTAQGAPDRRFSNKE